MCFFEVCLRPLLAQDSCYLILQCPQVDDEYSGFNLSSVHILTPPHSRWKTSQGTTLRDCSTWPRRQDLYLGSSLYRRERASLVAQMVKNLPAMWKTLVWSLGQEDPLEKGMVTHSSILAWRIPWTEEPGRLHSMELQTVGHDSAKDLA